MELGNMVPSPEIRLNLDKKLVKVLGRGKYGIVFEGECMFGGKKIRVAVKRVQLADVEQGSKGEDTLLKLKFDHVNVVKLFRFSDDNDFRYYALELCKAFLDQLYLNDGDIKIYTGPVPSIQDMLLQLAKGLEYIHGKGLAHRDVKPSNVLISDCQTDNNEDKQVAVLKWADFGFTKQTTDRGSYSLTSGVKGTHNWLAPEQIENMDGQINYRGTNKSDIFSEGLVFAYIILEGQRLYDSKLITKESVMTKDFLFNHKWDRALMFNGMLKKKPNERLSAKQVVQLLENYSSSQVEALDQNNSVYIGIFEGKYVALKNIKHGLIAAIDRNQDDWRKLMALKNENIIIYHQLITKDSARYLVMDLCVGSMREYLQDQILKDTKKDTSRIMFEVAHGLAYLHEENIIHGCLTLEKILLWGDDKAIVKITGYIHYLDNDQVHVEDDLLSLGNIFYSMATRDVNKPTQNLTLVKSNLIQLEKSQRLDALDLIKSLLKLKNASFHPTTVKELLVHPLFTINVEDARRLLNDNRFVNVEELQQWYNQLSDNEKTKDFDQDNFADLKEKVSFTFRYLEYRDESD